MKWMKNRALRCGIALWMPLVMASSGVEAVGDNPPNAQSASMHHGMSDGDWAALFDEKTPLADRQRTLAAIEQSPDTQDPQTLYMLGSIYHMGKHAPGSPAQEDPRKAILYLSNAAIRGSVLAMAKMAEIKLAAGQYREAMNWAEIYGHYAPIAQKKSDIQDSYAAELLYRAKQGLDDSAMDGIMKDIRSFVFAYDSTIRAGIADDDRLVHLKPHSRGRYFQPAINHERQVNSGMADYLLTFGADGSVIKAQLVDAEPLPDTGTDLLHSAEQMTVGTSSDNAARYAWVPMLLSDMRYHLNQNAH